MTGKLSKNLQEELQFELRLNILKMSRILMRFSEKVLKQLSFVMEEVRFSPEELILVVH
jgi:hypothetical protein